VETRRTEKENTVQTAEKKKANVQRRREVEKRVAKYLVDCRRING